MIDDVTHSVMRLARQKRSFTGTGVTVTRRIGIVPVREGGMRTAELVERKVEPVDPASFDHSRFTQPRSHRAGR